MRGKEPSGGRRGEFPMLEAGESFWEEAEEEGIERGALSLLPPKND